MFSILRQAQVHAGTDAAVAATAGSEPEGFHLIFNSSQDWRELGWSQIDNPQTDPGQANHRHTEDQDTSG